MFPGKNRGFTPATPAPPPTDLILDVVTELLETGGYDAVQLREVARRAHVGPATIYKLFASRDALIVTALERWMAANPFADLAPPADDESLYDGLMRMYHYVFEPWERSPLMLEAFYRARCGPGGERLARQGMNAVQPLAQAVWSRAEPAYAEDIGVILVTVVHGLLARFANGEIEITEILPTLETTVARLTANNEPAARGHRARRRSRNQR